MNRNKNLCTQDAFLKKVTSNELMIHIYLSNGLKMKGKIIEYDNFSLLLKKNDSTLLIYKHSISSIIIPNSSIKRKFYK